MDPSSLGRLRVVAGRVFIAQLPVHRCLAGRVFITQRPAHCRSAVSLVNHAATTAAVGARTGRSTNVEAAHVSDHNMTGATGSPPARSLALGFISPASPCDGSAPKTAAAMADQINSALDVDKLPPRALDSVSLQAIKPPTSIKWDSACGHIHAEPHRGLQAQHAASACPASSTPTR